MSKRTREIKSEGEGHLEAKVAALEAKIHNKDAELKALQHQNNALRADIRIRDAELQASWFPCDHAFGDPQLQAKDAALNAEVRYEGALFSSFSLCCR